MVKAFLADAHFSLRNILRHPGFTGVVLLTLAVSIGAFCSIFSVISNALIRPLPFREAERIFLIWENNPQKEVEQSPTSPGNFLDWQRQTRSFERLAAFRRKNINLTGSDLPERISSAVVSEAFFPLLGAQPMLGRFLVEDDQGQRVVVIGEGLWRRHFAADREIIGKRLILDGESFTIVGIMPTTFRTPREAELWIPLSFSPEDAAERGGRSLTVYGRLKKGVEIGSAEAEMNHLAQRLGEQYPDSNQGWRVSLVPLRDQWLGGAKTALIVLQVAVGLVLLISCANISNLLLARMQGRRGEFAVRMALGANQGRLLRQMLTESFILTLIGGGLGLLLAFGALRLLPVLGAKHLPWLDGIHIDGWVIASAFLVSLVMGTIIGAVPAIQLSSRNLLRQVGDNGVRSTAGAHRQLFQRFLVVVEVSLALVLMIGAGLLLESYRQLQEVETGFTPANVLTSRVVLSETRYPERHQWISFFQEILNKIRANPSVETAAAGTTVPFTGTTLTFRVAVAGRPALPGEEYPEFVYNAVTPGYFRAIGTRLVKGRDFSEIDRPEAHPVVIVSDSLARTLLPGEEPIGKLLRVGGSDEPPREIVGVVEDVKTEDLSAPAQATVYLPYVQDPWEFMTFVVRTRVQPETVADDLRRAVFEADHDQPVFAISSMEQRLSDSLSQRRFSMVLLSSFAVLALILAFVGVYGLISYQVTQSTHEIGIRIALGAQQQDVFGLVLGRVLRLVALGVLVGLGASLLLTRFLEHLLFGIGTTDVRAFVALSLLLVLAGTVAGYLPARRAMRVEPVVALKYE